MRLLRAGLNNSASLTCKVCAMRDSASGARPRSSFAYLYISCWQIPDRCGSFRSVEFFCFALSGSGTSGGHGPLVVRRKRHFACSAKDGPRSTSKFSLSPVRLNLLQCSFSSRHCAAVTLADLQQLYKKLYKPVCQPRANRQKRLILMARPPRLERGTLCLEGRNAIVFH